MSFWRSASSTRARRCVLVDISSGSVACACAAYPNKGPAILIWTLRESITPREGETAQAGMLRTLEPLLGRLVTEGLPALARVVGAGSLDGIRVSIDAPWQEIEIRIEEERDEQAFTYTHRLRSQMLEAAKAAREDDATFEIEQHVLGTRLNGYQTHFPVGKKANRVHLVVMTSRIRRETIAAIQTLLRQTLHASHASYVSGPALRYRAVRNMFPHERSLLILDSACRAGAISLIRAGALVAVHEFVSQADGGAWVAKAGEVLRTLATTYPLPRTTLLVSTESEAISRTEAFSAAKLGALWLAEEPPRLIPVTRVAPEELAMGPEAVPDIRLSLIAQYEQSGTIEE